MERRKAGSVAPHYIFPSRKHVGEILALVSTTNKKICMMSLAIRPGNLTNEHPKKYLLYNAESIFHG